MSKKSDDTIGIKDLIQALGLLFLAVSSFIAFTFIFHGNLSFAIPSAILIVLITYGLVYVLRKLKTVRRNQAEMRIWEYVVFIVGYIGIIGVGTLVIFVHFINIQFTYKDTIQRKAAAYTENIKAALVSYETYVAELSAEFETEMDNAIRMKSLNRSDYIQFIEKYNISELDDENKREYLNAFREAMLSSEYEALRNRTNAFIRKARNSLVEGWNPIAAPQIYEDLPERLEETKNKLKEISREHIRGREDTYEPSKYLSELSSLMDLSDPLVYFVGSNWLLVVPLFLLMHLLILWTYVFESRHDKAGVIKFSSQENEGSFEM